MDLSSFQAAAVAAMAPVAHPRVGAALALGEECGEVLRAVLDLEVYGRDARAELRAELGDVLLALAEVAAAYDVDLGPVAGEALAKLAAAVPGWAASSGPHLAARRATLDAP